MGLVRLLNLVIERVVSLPNLISFSISTNSEEDIPSKDVNRYIEVVYAYRGHADGTPW